MITQNRLLPALACGLAVIACWPETAMAQNVTTGIVQGLFADPTDFVISLDKPGRCGSIFFHIQRSAMNFKEVVTVETTAFAMGKPLTAFTVSCISDRNIIDHVFTAR